MIAEDRKPVLEIKGTKKKTELLSLFEKIPYFLTLGIYLRIGVREAVELGSLGDAVKNSFFASKIKESLDKISVSFVNPMENKFIDSEIVTIQQIITICVKRFDVIVEYLHEHYGRTDLAEKFEIAMAAALSNFANGIDYKSWLESHKVEAVISEKSFRMRKLTAEEYYNQKLKTFESDLNSILPSLLKMASQRDEEIELANKRQSISEVIAKTIKEIASDTILAKFEDSLDEPLSSYYAMGVHLYGNTVISAMLHKCFGPALTHEKAKFILDELDVEILGPISVWFRKLDDLLNLFKLFEALNESDVTSEISFASILRFFDDRNMFGRKLVKMLEIGDEFTSLNRFRTNQEMLSISDVLEICHSMLDSEFESFGVTKIALSLQIANSVEKVLSKDNALIETIGSYQSLFFKSNIDTFLSDTLEFYPALLEPKLKAYRNSFRAS